MLLEMKAKTCGIGNLFVGMLALVLSGIFISPFFEPLQYPPLPPRQTPDGACISSIRNSAEFTGLDLARHGFVSWYINGLPSALNLAIDFARTGNAEAEYVMGWMWSCGYGNNVVARENLRHLSGPSFVQMDEAINAYIKLSFAESDVRHEASYQIARDWYKMSYAHGCAKAAEELGFLCEYGCAGTYDEKQALQWYQKAANAGDPVAVMDLAYMYELGKGCKPDIRAAMTLYEKAYQNPETSEWATENILRLWATDRAVPSAACRKGAKTLEEFLEQIHFYKPENSKPAGMDAEYIMSCVFAGHGGDLQKEIGMMKNQHKLDFARYLSDVEYRRQHGM